jgi:hypothetical protein
MWILEARIAARSEYLSSTTFDWLVGSEAQSDEGNNLVAVYPLVPAPRNSHFYTIPIARSTQSATSGAGRSGCDHGAGPRPARRQRSRWPRCRTILPSMDFACAWICGQDILVGSATVDRWNRSGQVHVHPFYRSPTRRSWWRTTPCREFRTPETWTIASPRLFPSRPSTPEIRLLYQKRDLLAYSFGVVCSTLSRL